MAVQIIPPTIDIILDIPDSVIADTVIKRRVKLFTMVYNQRAKYVVLNWIVSSFANDSGNYGAPLAGLIPDYTQDTIADNNTFVDPATGAILLPVPISTTNPVTNEVVITEGFEIDYMGQYDWFNMLAETTPIHVHDMIRTYGAAVATWD